MKHQSVTRLSMLVILSCMVFVVQCFSQVSFDKVEVRTTFGNTKQGSKGRLIIQRDGIRFVKKNGTEYFSIPPTAVTELFYSRVSGRRIGTAILLSPVFLLFKGRKHYMTISFDDGVDLVGALEFKLHKSNYRPILRAIEQVGNVTMVYDQEGIKDQEQIPASRDDSE